MTNTTNKKVDSMAKELYKHMYSIRKFEDQTSQLYGRGSIAGFLHLYNGQEAIAVACISASNKVVDTYITSYRCHGHLLALGTEPQTIMDELTGKKSGLSLGLGGSMHMYDKSRNFYGGNGIVGAQVSLGTGLALKHKRKNDGGVAFTFFGDGAANQGQVAESMNMATLYNLPIVYVLEDNKYAMGTSRSRHKGGGDYAKLGASWNMKTIIVEDGESLYDTFDAFTQARKYASEESKPVFLYIKTYRLKGHSISDPGLYRSKDELNMYKEEKDPVKVFKQAIISKKLMTEEEISELEKSVTAQMKEVAKNASIVDPLSVTEFKKLAEI